MASLLTSARRELSGAILSMLLFLLIPFAAPAQSTVQWKTNYYAVTGLTLPDIHESLRQTRSRKNTSTDGETAWRVRWRFRVEPSPGGCRCASFSTETFITITLPRWIATTNTPADVKSVWTRYITALEKHELGHAKFALDAAAELQKRINELGERPDCAALQREINSLGERIVDEHRRREKEYDARTQHGIVDGAFLPARFRFERDLSPK